MSSHIFLSLFHPMCRIFPQNPTMRKAWIIACRRKDWMPSKYSHLCSAHFTEDLIDRTSLSCIRLREKVVPNVFKTFSSTTKNDKINKKIEANGDDHDQDEQKGNSNSSYKVNPQHGKDDAESSDVVLENPNDLDDVGNSKKKRKITNVTSSSDKILDGAENGSVQQSSEREEIFGQYVACEMKTLRDDPLLYLQTKQAILEILTCANFELINPE